jgi:hypothetical protein
MKVVGKLCLDNVNCIRVKGIALSPSPHVYVKCTKFSPSPAPALEFVQKSVSLLRGITYYFITVERIEAKNSNSPFMTFSLS